MSGEGQRAAAEAFDAELREIGNALGDARGGWRHLAASPESSGQLYHAAIAARTRLDRALTAYVAAVRDAAMTELVGPGAWVTEARLAEALDLGKAADNEALAREVMEYLSTGVRP